MLRDNYKKAFSQINPSEETIEKVFEMTEKKRFNRIRKGLIIAIALIAILLCGTLTANAATDGALFEGIGYIINGGKIEFGEYVVNHKFYVDEDGNGVDKYEKIDLNDHLLNSHTYVDENGTETEVYSFDIDGDGISDHVYYVLSFNSETQDDTQD